MRGHDRTAYRSTKVIGISLAILGIAFTSASAAESACDGVKVEVTKARKQEYAPLVAAAMENKVKPAQVEFETIMESGNWSAAYISTPVADDGMMFFQTVNGEKAVPRRMGRLRRPVGKT